MRVSACRLSPGQCIIDILDPNFRSSTKPRIRPLSRSNTTKTVDDFCKHYYLDELFMRALHTLHSTRFADLFIKEKH